MTYTKDELKTKKTYHSKRVAFYDKKIKDLEAKIKRIRFKHYD